MVAPFVQTSPFFRLSLDEQCALWGSFLDEGESLRAREVCKIWKIVIDAALKSKWNELKKSPPSGPIHFARAMQRQERLHEQIASDNPLVLFRGVNDVFRKWKVGTFSGEIRIHRQHFQNLQLALYHKLVDQSLMSSWERIWLQLKEFVDSFPNATELREWLNDPQTEAYRALIERIDLNDLGIRYIPIELCRFPNLYTLNLSENHIDVLPSFLGEIPSLRTLLLEDNDLQELPKGFSAWTHIERIELGDNPLRPETFDVLTQWQRNKRDPSRMEISD